MTLAPERDPGMKVVRYLAERKILVAAGHCDSSLEQLRAAIDAGATFYLTGEMRHHDALAAAQAGMTVVCVGHSNSERLALARLAARLRQLLPKLDVLLSAQDKDPFEIQ